MTDPDNIHVQLQFFLETDDGIYELARQTVELTGSAESEGLLVPPGATIVKVTRMAAAPEAPWRPPGPMRDQ